MIYVHSPYVCVISFSKAAIYDIIPDVNIFENAHVLILTCVFYACLSAVKTLLSLKMNIVNTYTYKHVIFLK